MLTDFCEFFIVSELGRRNIKHAAPFALSLFYSTEVNPTHLFLPVYRKEAVFFNSV